MTNTLVLLPGLDGTGILFEPFLRELPPEIIPQVIPLPSQVPMGYESLVPIVTSHLPNTGSYFLLGESFSGPLSLMIAATRPAGLQGVILCASFIRNPTYVPSILRVIVGTWMFRMIPQMAQAKTLMSRYSTSELRALLARVHLQVAPAVTAQRIRSILALDCRKALKECPVPLAYIRGALDGVVPARNCREILAIKPSVREFVIRAPHMILQTQPRAAADVISAFMRTVG